MTGLAHAGQPTVDETVDKVEDNQLIFKNKELKPLKTGLFEVSYLGAIQPPEGGQPYHLVVGRPCKDCLQDKGVYAVRSGGSRVTHFVHPGKILDPKTRAVLLDSRAFYGRCLNGAGDVYIAFQKERIDRRHQLQASVFVAQPAQDYLQEKLMERRLPSLQATLHRVKTKSCWEIAPYTRVMLRKPLNLNARPNNDADASDDDDDDDSDPKENQTAHELAP